MPGGALVGEQVGTEVETALRASSVVVRAGGRVLSGLKSNFSLPLEKTVSSLNWYPELVSTDFSQSDGTMGQANFSPNRLVGAQQINVQLVEARMPSEEKWYALTGRVVDAKVEADGDIHIAFEDATGNNVGTVSAETPDLRT